MPQVKTLIQHRTGHWHRTCQAQQRKANPVALATERRRLQEALAANVALTFSRSAVGMY